MRITCLITVCAYLSSTVFTDKIQYSNRPRRVRLQEESVLDDATARKELNPNRGTRPYVYPLRNFRSHRQIETYQKPFQKKTSESQPSPQQHPRDRSRRSIKRLKVRSIDGSTYEVDDNKVHEFHEIHESIPEVHDEGPIYIKPVVRVTTKNNNVFDSILEILSQLLDPPKKKLGPIVGPIKLPGTKRNVYLRLLEPVDSSHINVRFVSQIPVPVVDEESILSRKHQSVLPFLPYGDLSTTLLHQHHYASSDATFSSSNRHHSVQLPRNASHVSGKGRKLQPKPATKVKRPPPEELKETDEKTVKPVKETVSKRESNENNLYYQYQSEDDAVKEVSEIIKGATKNGQGSENFLEHQLTTHRLPYRQIAPLYPLSVMEHTDSGSYQNTYTVPSDSHAGPTPSTYSNYEQYGNVNAEPSGYYDQSSYTIPNTYATTYQKQNEFSNAPSSYPISYQNHNEFTNAPSSTSYAKQNDLYSAPTSHTSSYEKPASVPPTPSFYATSYEAPNGIQTGSSSQNALRVIDPLLYFPPKFSENHANKVYKHPTIQPQPYNLPNANERSSLRNTAQNGKVPIDQVTWGKVKREKGESNFQKNEMNFQKSVEVTSDSNREKWQPLMFVPEDTDWQKAVANLAKVANGNHEDANGNHEIVYGNHYHEAIARQPSVNRPRQVSPEGTIDFERLVAQHQRGQRRNYSAASTQNSKCSTSNRSENCKRTEPRIVSTPLPEDTINIVEAAQLTANTEAIVTKSVASTTVEMSRPNATKSSWIEEPQALVMTTESLATSSTTEKSPLSIKVMKSTTEKSITVNKTTTSGSMKNNVTEKSGWIVSSTTERLPISSTLKGLIPRNNTMKRQPLPKRPMIMKKPTFVLKNAELSSTTRRTVASSTRKTTVASSTWKPTTKSTTEKTKTTRRMKFQDAKTKSSTT